MPNLFEALGIGAGGFAGGFATGTKLRQQQEQQSEELKLRRQQLDATIKMQEATQALNNNKLMLELQKLMKDMGKGEPIGAGGLLKDGQIIPPASKPEAPDPIRDLLMNRLGGGAQPGQAPQAPLMSPGILTPDLGNPMAPQAPATPPAASGALGPEFPQGATYSKGGLTVPLNPKPATPHYIPRSDGSVLVVDTPGAEPRLLPGADPIKTAQAYTPQIHYLRAAQKDGKHPEWKPGMVPSPEHATDAIALEAKAQGARTAERTQAQIDVKTDPENIKKEARLAEAMMGARKRVGLEYLPLEVRIRAQEQLNVATDPENIEAVAKKITQEEIARGNGQRLPENDKQVLALMNTTLGALDELKTRFTPEQRKQYVGILRNPALKAKQILSGDKGFAEFQALMGRIRKSAFDDGGKQLTPFEFQVIAQYVPQGNENSWEDFEAKLAIAGNYTKMLMEARTKYATITRDEVMKKGLPRVGYGGGGNVPAPPTTPPGATGNLTIKSIRPLPK